MKKLIVLLSLITLSFLLIGCRSQSQTELSTVKNLNDLQSLIKSSRDNQSTLFSNFFTRSMQEDAAMDDNLDSGNDNAQSHSETNVQVDGVDESDTIKTDGDRIYSITYNRLNIIDIESDGSMSHAKQFELNTSSNSYYTGLYLTEKYLVVIGQSYGYYNYSDSRDKDSTDDHSYYYSMPTTTIEIIALDSLELVETYSISGHLATTRLIGEQLYIISNHNTYMSEDSDPRPQFSEGENIFYPDFNSIYYIEDMPYEGFTIISHIALEDTIEFDYTVFLGAMGWGHIYMNHTAIYLATNIYRATLMRQSYDGLLMRYAIGEDGSVSYFGRTTYEGFILNQFSMDEYNDTFRIATTEGFNDSVVNRLYVFSLTDGSIKQIGLIDEGLGKPRETIRSVRFNQDKATVVTYELTDPFYIIDLSNPSNPTITGELEITGFSTYQHPWHDDFVLGLGYEADGNTILGLKLSLYDVSDDKNPKEVGDPLVLDNSEHGWQYSEALHNHKALLIEPDLHYFGFSIWRYQWLENRAYYGNDYLIFTVDSSSETPIELVASISHSHLVPSLNDNNHYYYYYSYSIERAVRINDYLYVVSGEAVTRHTMTDYEELEALVLHD